MVVPKLQSVLHSPDHYSEQDYNSYYRPNKDDDKLTFYPSQGVLPLYYFEHGQLRGTIEPIYLKEELKEDLHASSHVHIIPLFYLFILLLLFSFLKRNLFKYHSLI